MIGSAGISFLRYFRTSSDRKTRCLENPARRAEYSLTESASSPVQVEPRQNRGIPTIVYDQTLGAIRNSHRLHRGFNTQRRMSFLLLSASALRPSWSSFQRLWRSCESRQINPTAIRTERVRQQRLADAENDPDVTPELPPLRMAFAILSAERMGTVMSEPPCRIKN